MKPMRAQRVSWVGLLLSALAVVAVSLPAGAWAACTISQIGTAPGKPTQIPSGLKDVVQLSSSENYTLALKSNGTVAMWGSSTPWSNGSTAVSNLTNITAVAAAKYHALFLKSDGTVVALEAGKSYGANEVPAGLKGVTSIAAGYASSYALKSDGSVVAWGSGWGDQTSVSLANGATGFKAISAKGSTAAGLRTDGSVVIWRQGIPQAPASEKNFVALAANGVGVIALKNDGTVKFYGHNYGKIVYVPSSLKNVVAISCGSASAAAVKSDGTVALWGDNLGSAFKNEVLQAKGVWAVAFGGSEHLSLGTCSEACGAVGPTGCCAGNARRTCDADGKTATETCANATCGWKQVDGGYACNTVGAAAPFGNFVQTCGPTSCTKNCTNKACGSDGCFGSCGTCGVGKACDAATSQCKPCTPSCTGKACGSDGCGGSCGNCGAGKTCNATNNQCCVPSCAGKTCGTDGCGGSCGGCVAGQKCNVKGTCDIQTCGVANPACKACVCKSDAVCCTTWDAKCDTNCSGTCATACAKICTPSCQGKTCGSDGCGGSCGTCSSGETCDAASGQCKCIPKCAGKKCGSDGCGGTCGPCAANEKCNAAGTLCLCVADCKGKVCGSDGCGGWCGDCTTPGTTCDATKGQCVCKPKCDGRDCGSDGCGGTCGVCGATEQCNELFECKSTICTLFNPGCKACVCTTDPWCCTKNWSASCDAQCNTNCKAACSKVCTPKCKGKTCGDDGCGGTCGTCKAGDACSTAGYCECKPQCDGKQCGADGCNWHCGLCSSGSKCGPGGQCCVANCAGKKCGSDGCGGSCGSCTQKDETCDGKTGQCKYECVPSCGGKTCGADGCGGQCGTCASAQFCHQDSGQCRFNASPKIPAQGCCQLGDVASVGSAKGTSHINCAAKGQYCGFEATTQKWGCMTKPNIIDAYGKTPRLCPAVPNCTPTCAGKECGTDGCGGSCGGCAAGKKCDVSNNKCVVDPCNSVPGSGCCVGQKLYACDSQGQFNGTDCGATGKFLCGWDGAKYACGTGGNAGPSGASAKSCPAAMCVPNCSGKTCGSDGCGGVCGACLDGKSCTSEGKCKVPCTPKCDDYYPIGKTATGTKIYAFKCNNHDGCGGLCGCPKGKECTSKDPTQWGTCRDPVPDKCNGIPYEPCCDGDTLKQCFFGKVSKFVYETKCNGGSSGNCGWDTFHKKNTCWTNGGLDPSGTKPKLCPGAACKPNCSGLQCGPDGCGGTCGTCKQGGVCDKYGLCINTDGCQGYPLRGCCDGNTLRRCQKQYEGSTAQLKNQNCGGQQCGWHKAAYHTVNSGYRCLPQHLKPAPDPTGKHPAKCPCFPQCQGKTCGSDGCGGVCGTCPAGQDCGDGSCCKGSCAGKSCGSDGCAGQCGSCATGQKCANGQCVTKPPPPTCANTSWEGSCNGDVLQYCGNNKITIEDCAGNGHCGWNAKIGAYSCGTGGGADPSGKFAKAAPGTQATCLPQCSGKQCGDDGCGGTCGSCLKGAECKSGWCEQKYGTAGVCPEAAYGAAFAWGKKASCCAPPKAGQTKHMLWSCTQYNDGFTSQSAKDCGTLACGVDSGQSVKCWSPGKGIAAPTGKFLCKDCGTCDKSKPCSMDNCGNPCSTCAPGKGCNYATGLCQVDNQGSCSDQCGQKQKNPAQKCQCDPGCVDRGDCCKSYQAYCLQSPPTTGSCGDGTCNDKFGENCVTCAADCGTCKSNAADASTPRAPFAQVLAAYGTLAQTAYDIVHQLDQVLPAAHPYGVDGLLAHIPRASINVASPHTLVVAGASKTGGKIVDVAGALGGGIGLQTKGKPTFGGLRILPERDLPRASFQGDAAPGGMSVAFWVRTPASAAKVLNPLLSLRGTSESERQCIWSRPNDSKVKIACKPPQAGLPAPKILRLRAYFGSTQNKPASDGSCGKYDKLGADFTCAAPAVQLAAEKACLGKDTCVFDALAGATNPCAGSSEKPLLAVEAVCGYGKSYERGKLFITDSAGHNRLTFALGNSTLESTRSVSAGLWHHIAMTFHPYPGSKVHGIRSLYIDGELVAQNSAAKQFTFNEVLLGVAEFKGAVGINKGDGNKLAAIADFDDVFLYERSLGDSEIRSLMNKRDAKLLRVWPAQNAAKLVASRLWLAGGLPSVSDIVASWLQVQSGGGPFKADWKALALPGTTTFAAGHADADLGPATSFTLAGWVSVKNLTAGKTLLQLTLDGTPQVTIQTAAACNKHGVTANTLDNPKIAATGCNHGVAADEWAFIAFVQQGTGQSLYVDGNLMGSGSLAKAATIFAGAKASQVRALKSSPDGRLGWAAYFDRALSVDELEGWRSPGPAVWLDGGTTVNGDIKQLRDFASFHNNGPNGSRDRPVGRTTDGSVMTTGNSSNPVLRLLDTPWTMSQITLAARGRFRPIAGSATRAVTWAGRVGLNANNLTPTPLFALLDGGSAGKTASVRLDARLLCSKNASAVACRVDVTGYKVDGGFAAWSTETRKVVATGAIEAAVAIAWDGKAPRVTFGFPNNGVPSAKATVSVGTAPAAGATVALPTAIPGSFWQMRAPNGNSSEPSGKSVEFRNVRFYTRPLTDLELALLGVRDCAALGCETSGATCGAGSSTTPACAGCSAKYNEASGTLGALCLKKQGYFSTCSVNTQCASGLCDNGRCVTTQKTKECTDRCDALGRTCEVLHPGSQSQVTRCSPTCQPYYDQPELNPTTGLCVWHPTAQPGEGCAADDQCAVTGVCAKKYEKLYNVSVVWNPTCSNKQCPVWKNGSKSGAPFTCQAKYGMGGPGSQCPPVTSASIDMHYTGRCAVAAQEECLAQHRTASVLSSPGRDGKKALQCGSCVNEFVKDAKLGSVPKWVERWRLMSPLACKLMHDTLVKRHIVKDPKKPTGDSWLGVSPSGTTLRQFVLDKPGSAALTPAEMSELELKGIGPEFIDIALIPQAYENWYKKYPYPMVLGDCAIPHMTIEGAKVPSVFFDPNINHPVCVVNKLSNGSKCPPAGEPVATKDAWCKSGFCARDSGVCETGFGLIESTDGADRDDKQQGDEFSISLAQRNNATMQFRRLPVAGSPNTFNRGYSLGLSTSSTLRMFGETKEVFGLYSTMTANMEAKEKQDSLRLFIAGIQLPNVLKSDAKFEKCQPIGSIGCVDSDKITKGGKTTLQEGPLCFKQTTLVGPVPITMEASPVVEACISVGNSIDPMTFEPEFEVTPSIKIAVEVKGGVGAGKAGIEVFAGVKAAITVVKLSFPTVWALAVSKVANVQNLWNLSLDKKTSIAVSILDVSLGLFAELKIGPVPFSKEKVLLEIEGLKLAWEIASTNLGTMKVDFQHKTAGQKDSVPLFP